MRDRKIVKTEYAVEVNDVNTDSFIRQIDIFETYDEAEDYIKKHKDLSMHEYYNIIAISYDENGDEVEFHTV